MRLIWCRIYPDPRKEPHMTSPTVSRRPLLSRIAKLEKLLEELPKAADRAERSKRVHWKRILRGVRRHIKKIEGSGDTCTPLTLLKLSDTVMRKLASYKVVSLETLGNIDTSSLRTTLRGQPDRLVSTVLVKLHPDSSGR
jgi:hypothetical protein